ncbi:MAG: biotin/lipoyl-binding protein [Pirellulales bacterium]|nr:biotin/lipoyl-binding protein [Pirellulales bacterium]
MKLKLTIDGKTYEVEVDAAEPEHRRPAYVPAAPAARAPTATPAPARVGTEVVADESKVCRSPVAGVVVKVPVQTGQAIQPNDVLMVLEAMKMETSISSPIAGKIARLNAAVGDAVQGGQVLVEFE